MGKSYNRNQDKYNKWDRERQRRDHKKNKSKNFSRTSNLTSGDNVGSGSDDDGFTIRGSFSDESSY